MMKEMRQSSYLNSANAAFIEEQYAIFKKDPSALSADWRKFFQDLKSRGELVADEPDHQAIRHEFARLARESRAVAAVQPAARGEVSRDDAYVAKQVAVLQLINAYRFRGHQHADLDPLSLMEQEPVPELSLHFYKLDDSDLDTVFKTGSLVGPGSARLADILEKVRRIYCGHLGIEYMHISDTQEKRWLQQHIEGDAQTPALPAADRLRILQQLMAASEFERYLHARYVGQKRFSLEGAESLIPMLHHLINMAGAHKVAEVVMGMAHRGRLNVLTNILGKDPAQLFEEFEGKSGGATGTGKGSGDVKYHQGFSSDIQTAGGVVHVVLGFNPSHLEIVGPVVCGSVRARQQRRDDRMGSTVLPVLIHGDAAFSGQGVVMETFNMSQARSFKIGGTIHIIINNQIGFTTSNPLDSRSTTYCTEVARMVQAPILHVNGDNPEAVIRAMHIAMEFRMTYRKDVVVDLVCYRRHGHSEADEPAATQPVMYRKIRQHARVSQLYADQLIEQAVTSAEKLDAYTEQYRLMLDQGKTVAPAVVDKYVNKAFWVDWTPYLQNGQFDQVETTLTHDAIENLINRLYQLPENLTLHTSVRRTIDERKKMAVGELPMDWGFAETVAYASLLDTGHVVRLSGQDSGRGTFFHRHAILHDQQDGSTYTPFHQIARKDSDFVAIDSLLSEEAVLAFEYGYSTAAPEALVIWEAQFGDFANGAQVVIDQFITSGRSKWGRLSGLVMFLPHGFDGQGPEHSSARLERYLQLCAENNVAVYMPSEPAQMFHLLRRQVLGKTRIPLVIMTPKSLLRHKLSTSHLEDLSTRGFRPVIDDPDVKQHEKIRRLVVCSGKVFYDLLDARRNRQIEDIAIIRLEQLYPFPTSEYFAVFEQYTRATDVVWCQEEPQNQGAWQYIWTTLRDSKREDQTLSYAGRPASASPAVGYYTLHTEQLKAFINDALQ